MRQHDDLTKHLMEVWLQQRARLIRLCTRMTGKSDVAEDLVQETLLGALLGVLSSDPSHTDQRYPSMLLR